MTSEQFAYWLQGFTELTPDMPVPSPAQWQAIKDHLQTVFIKVTPQYQAPSTGMPGQIRSAELRHEDALRHLMSAPINPWPGSGVPALIC